MTLFSKTSLSAAALALLGLAATVPAHAQVGLYTFEGDTGKATTFSDTSGGITATFSSPADPNGFLVTPNPAFGSMLLSGNVLADGVVGATGNNTPLTIAFNKNLSSLTLDFVDASALLNTPQTFTLQAFENGVSVGSLTVPGLVPVGGQNAEGVIGFFGTFNSVQLSSATSDGGLFAIDNVGVVAAPAVPEASTTVSFSLLLALGLGAVAVAKKKKQTA